MVKVLTSPSLQGGQRNRVRDDAAFALWLGTLFSTT